MVVDHVKTFNIPIEFNKYKASLYGHFKCEVDFYKDEVSQLQAHEREMML